MGEYDLCELEEDALTNNTNNLSSNGTAGLDTLSNSSGTTAVLPHDDLLLESSSVSENGVGGTALKPSIIKQNGNNKMMSVVHSYNYTGKPNGCPLNETRQISLIKWGGLNYQR